MMSIASMLSVSNLSTIGFLEDDEDDDYSYMWVVILSQIFWLVIIGQESWECKICRAVFY